MRATRVWLLGSCARALAPKTHKRHNSQYLDRRCATAIAARFCLAASDARGVGSLVVPPVEMHRRACCAVLFAASCFAYSYYPPRLPNGEKIQRSYGSFGHVGFKSSGTAGNARPNINAFGDSFDMVGNIWTEEFCLR